MLRNPVERAYSHYVHLMDERAILGVGSVISFERAIEEIPEIVDTSLYLMQIERFLEYFPGSALHVMTLDDLQTDPEKALGALQEFLGVMRLPLGTGRSRVVDNRSGDRLVRVTTRRATERVRSSHLLRSASRLVPRMWRVGLVARLETSRLARRIQERRLETHRARLSVPSPTLRAQLLQRLRRPTRELEDFLERRLPGWLE
jgi:hypothetical protein